MNTFGVADRLSRRAMLVGATRWTLCAAGLVVASGCGSVPRLSGAIGSRLETTTIRLRREVTCTSVADVADGLLHAEGFTDVQWMKPGTTVEGWDRLAAGNLDIAVVFVPPLLIRIAAGAPIVFLAGFHPGCVELFGNEHVQAIRDLKGKSVGINEPGGAGQTFAAMIAAYVGLDPASDINWVVLPNSEAERARFLVDGKVDAYVAFPWAEYEIRASGIGHVVVSTMADRPWSQHYCCMVAGNRDFVLRNPVATMRAARALLNAADYSVREPERTARMLVDSGDVPRYDYELQLLNDLPHGWWHEYDPEDSVRFYALRLRDAGMISTSPEKLVAEATDWRFLNAIKAESTIPAASAPFVCPRPLV
ncbi:MAG: ABC transporter substrate-binding protein [Chloroflexi bacterium]|nr:MAG: ABC transporter substrate-binding protein [Chloroflexota bacterium]